MSVIKSIENLVVRSGRDFKHNEMQDMFTPTSSIMKQNLAVMSSLQERAIRNENAYNEMAIKMSEYNAISGEDEIALANKINETQSSIKEKVDEDGGWYFADTAVSDGARRFLTDEGVKTILNNKAQWDNLMKLNEQSDAPEELKAANRAMILEKFNSAGGSLGGNGRQSISSFGTALGKGHDRSVYEKELLDMMKAWKADKRSVFNAEFINDITDLMNGINTDPRVQATAQKIIDSRGGNIPGIISKDSIIESISEDEIREVFKTVLSNRPEFRTAMAKEAEIYKWMNIKQGGTNSQLVNNTLRQYALTDDRTRQAILMASDFSKLNNTQQLTALQDPNIMLRYINQGIASSMPDLIQQNNESDEDYENRMGYIYNNIYTQQNIDSLLNLAKIGAYTAVETKTNTKWFDNFLIESMKDKKEQLKDIQAKMTEAIGFTRANLPANAMMTVVDTNIKTATDAMDNALSTMSKYANAEDNEGKYLYQVAEKNYNDAKNIIQQNRAIYDSMFTKFDAKNPQHRKEILDVKENLLDWYHGDNKEQLENDIKNLTNPNDIIDKFLEYGEGQNLYASQKDIIYTGGYSFSFSDSFRGKINRDNLTKYFITAADKVGIKPQTIPITLFTPISSNKAAFSDALEGLGKLFMDNTGIWNAAMVSLGNDPKNAKFVEHLIGMPVTANSDFADIFGFRKSGSGDKALYQISSKNLSIGSDNIGRLYLKVTIPAQGDNQVQREAILYTDDDGANMALKDAMTKGIQCCYNQAMTNPYDTYQKQTANELMSFAGNTESLTANLQNIVDPTARDLNRFNIINGSYANNVAQAIDIITNDNNINPIGNAYSITSGSFKYNITKHPSGIYTINVQQYNPNVNRYVNLEYNRKGMDFTFENNVSLRNNLPALIYKLNHGNELKANFAPTEYLTPRQKEIYNLKYWNTNYLML